MSTTLVSEPTPAPKAPPTQGVRFVAVRANLLPDEIVSARQLEAVRKQVLLGLALVVALLIGWFGLSWWQTGLANRDLDTAEHRATALQNQQNEFAPLVEAQSQVSTIHGQLGRLMAGDLPWKSMLTTLRADAPAGVTLTNVAATMTGIAAPNATTPNPAGALNQSGQQSVGQLTVTGTAGSKNAVAAYADRLAGVRGLTAPLITSVTANGGSVTFIVTVIITTDALGGRYHLSAATPTGGK